jgi:hypothetical protein
MNDQDGFDPRLAALFEREHRHEVSDAFVAATMRKIRAARRRRELLRTSARVAGVVAVVVASQWLIPGVERLNSAVQSSLSWTGLGLSGTGILGTLVVAGLLAKRLRRR